MKKFLTLRKPTLFLSVLVLIFFSSSCSQVKQESRPYSGNGESSPSAQSSDGSKTTENSKWIEYFDKYFDTDKGAEVVNKAMDLLTAKCMKDKGFDYKIEKKEEQKNQNSSWQFYNKEVADSDWGVTDVEYAKIYGYLPYSVAFLYYAGNPVVDDPDPNWPVAPKEEQDGFSFDGTEEIHSEDATESPEYEHAYSSKGGCLDTGETDFYNGLSVDATRTNQTSKLRMKIKETAMDDSEFTPKLKEWSSCIKTKEFDFDFPPTSLKSQAHDMSAKAQAPNPAFGAKSKLLLATADAQCKQQTAFIDYWHKVLDKVEERELRNNLPIFEAEKAYTDSMIKRGQEIIEKYGAEFS
jgi:hypothetical protein